MNSLLTRVSAARLVKLGHYLEIAGIMVLAPIFLTHHPLVMVFTIPIGSILLLLGWLSWLTSFIRTL